MTDDDATRPERDCNGEPIVGSSPDVEPPETCQVDPDERILWAELGKIELAFNAAIAAEKRLSAKSVRNAQLAEDARARGHRELVDILRREYGSDFGFADRPPLGEPLQKAAFAVDDPEFEKSVRTLLASVCAAFRHKDTGGINYVAGRLNSLRTTAWYGECVHMHDLLSRVPDESPALRRDILRLLKGLLETIDPAAQGLNDEKLEDAVTPRGSHEVTALSMAARLAANCGAFGKTSYAAAYELFKTKKSKPAS